MLPNLTPHNPQNLSSFITIQPQIPLSHILQTKFKPKPLQQKLYIQYHKLKPHTSHTPNIPLQFNPNKLTHQQILSLKQNIINYIQHHPFTTIHLPFHFQHHLTNYYPITHKPLNKTLFYPPHPKPQTKYFPLPHTHTFITIYNKKQQPKHNPHLQLISHHLSPLQIQLKTHILHYSNHSFNHLHIFKPHSTSPQKLNQQPILYILIHQQPKSPQFNKTTKYKYKNLIKQISPVHLTQLIKSTLKQNEKQLQ
ncbi:replication initiation protein, partial [Staphylococcus epidermidis]|uniref:replication initiation protein n=1 Tax=Staphylococcus epidermidis TaxID=1282 RepID=UPI0037DA167D